MAAEDTAPHVLNPSIPTSTMSADTDNSKPTPTTTATAPMPIEPLTDPEILAVSPPPQGPKQSQPAPPRPTEAPTSAVSPVVRKLETMALAVTPAGGDPSEFYVELPDTSVPRRPVELDKSTGGAAEIGGGEARKTDTTTTDKARGEGEASGVESEGTKETKPALPLLRAPVEDVSVLVAEDVVMTPGGTRLDFDDFEELLLGEKSLGGHWREEYGRQREKKRKDPAVLVEIPDTPSAQAYEVAQHNKLDEQYFAPVYEDKGVADEVVLPPPSRSGTAENISEVTPGDSKSEANTAEGKGSSVTAVATGAASAVKDAALKVMDTLTGGTKP